MSQGQQLAEAEIPEAPDAHAVLKERARALARPIAELVESASRSMIVFNLGDECCAIETRYVITVQRMCDVFPLPGAAAHVLGLTSVQGELLVVFDLRVLMGIARPAHSDATRMLILGDKQAELVVIADAVQDVKPIYDNKVFPLRASAEGAQPYSRGVTSDAVSVFDGCALLNDPRLYVDEASAGLIP
jgi:purine-binding chemotaxis protein CheW